MYCVFYHCQEVWVFRPGSCTHFLLHVQVYAGRDPKAANFHKTILFSQNFCIDLPNLFLNFTTRMP